MYLTQLMNFHIYNLSLIQVFRNLYFISKRSYLINYMYPFIFSHLGIILKHKAKQIILINKVFHICDIS